ncbi:MAG: NAD(P)(+) transhydrogenase (Re/Si-specific) subunit beta, partial [Desulfotignum sp.]
DFLILGLVFCGIWMFRNPDRARKGNFIAGAAMAMAASLVIFRHPPAHPYILLATLTAGALAGIWVVTRISMVQIPSMVAFQNGAGGLASFLIAFVELSRGGGRLHLVNEVSGLFGLAMGALTFSGSMIASGKLANKLSQTPVHIRRHTLLLGILFVGIAGLIILASALSLPFNTRAVLWTGIVIAASAFGVLFSVRVGGADMPVLISFLNATTGLAAALCGMVLGNKLLISCGAAVAASGSILTHVMCKAMNRSLYRVFVPLLEKSGTIQPLEGDRGSTPDRQKKHTAGEETDPLEKVAQVINDSASIIIVPGYGMAVAQAQFELIALTEILVAMGKKIQFAIHPVAGRMPGHMNVLLAEAGVDYDLLKEMDEINPSFKETDLVLVIGACDVVNPAAITANNSPISGMPILHVHEARHVVCCNMDDRPGYSGVQNPLYRNEQTTLLSGDAKQTIEKLTANVSQGGACQKETDSRGEKDVITSAAAELLRAQTIIFIPGYGMAQAQAQFEVVALSQLLEEMGKTVKFAIHPVAGRMPGHMNVLLAEADVEYDRLVEMDEINPEFQDTDVAVIFGACDVVNPTAMEHPGTPISGMPILMAHRAKSVIVCNYDSKPGYSGVENPLYDNPKTLMASGDAKATALKLTAALKNEI